MMKPIIDRRWLDPIDWIKCEQKQAEDEGKNKEKVAEYVNRANAENFAEIYRKIYDLPVESSFAFREPNDFETITKDLNRIEVGNFDQKQYLSKLRGAWLGRIIGCEMGKPVEGLMRKTIKEIEINTGNFPLNDYLENDKITDEYLEKIRVDTGFKLGRKWLKGSFDVALWDDDLNWTVLNMYIVERFGREFTSEHVLKAWLDSLPISSTCTAEKIAYKNAVNGIPAGETAVYANPFREWVGAAIRGDAFGYLNPANPYDAARMAYTDSRVSHVKNGIYGEIFVSVLTSLAFSVSDPRKLVAETIKAIPSGSRLFRDVSDVLRMYDEGHSQEEVADFIHSRYDEYDKQDAVHVLPNIMIVTMATLYGKDDIRKTLRYCIDTGFDTDSTTAIACSVWGIIHGYESIDKELYSLFHNLLETTIFGVGTISIDNLIERTAKLVL